MKLQNTVNGAVLLRAASASLYNESSLNHTCVLSVNSPDPSSPRTRARLIPITGPLLLSCSPGTVPSKVDSCCAETYGGLVLSTQFWDTYTGLEAEGQVLPRNSWTLHGLWPDFCNGSFTQYCDLNRQYDPSPSPNTTNGLSNGSSI